MRSAAMIMPAHFMAHLNLRTVLASIAALLTIAPIPAPASVLRASLHETLAADQQPLVGGSSARPDGDDEAPDAFLLLTRDGQIKSIRIASISDQSLVPMDETRGWVTLDLSQCIALVNAQADSGSLAGDAGVQWNQSRGLVVLADGQRLPGEPALDAPPQPDSLAWNHPWLGRIDVPLKFIESVLLQPGAVAPPAGEADVVLLANGDLRHGLVTSIGDTVSIETTVAPGTDAANAAPGGAAAQTTKETMDIPLSRVVAIRMIAQRQTGQGRRVWFSEGTVLDVQSIVVSDNGLVRMTGGPLAGSLPPAQVGLGEIAAILFDRQRLLALASLAPSRVEGPATRYTLPKPAILNPQAPLGLSTVEFSGPITVRYALPAGCERFIAEAELPREARAWGDCELIVRSDDAELVKTRLRASSPTASINVPLPAKAGGRELTIEITAGAHGPIQDLVRLRRPMLAKGGTR